MNHKLTQLERRKLDMLLARHFDVRPAADERAFHMSALTDSVKMCVHTVGLLAQTPVGDPARMYLMQSAMDMRKCSNLLARSMTENPLDFAFLIEPARAVLYSLDARQQHQDKVKYIRELAEIADCQFQQNTIVGEPWHKNCCWIIPTDKTDLKTVVEFLLSENIPYELEAMVLLNVFIHQKPDHAPTLCE